MQVEFPLFKWLIANWAKNNQVEIVSFEEKEGIQKQWHSQVDAKGKVFLHISISANDEEMMELICHHFANSLWYDESRQRSLPSNIIKSQLAIMYFLINIQ